MATVAQAPYVCVLWESDEDVNFYCVTCGEIHCARCKMSHSKSRKTRKDEIISLSEAILQNKLKSSVTLCNDHESEELTLFCERCYQYICIECMAEKHTGHKITTLKKIKAKEKELISFKTEIEKTKCTLNEALCTEQTFHTTNTKHFEQIGKEISDHASKIFQEVTTLRDENLKELCILQQKEDHRHSNSCTNIQFQTQTLTSAIQLMQTGIDSGNPITMDKAKEDAAHAVQNVNIPILPHDVSTKFQPGNINRPAVLPLFGNVLTEDKGAMHKQPHSNKISKYQRDDKKQQGFDIIQHKIYTNRVSIKFTLFASHTKESIKVIVPVKDNAAWVAAEGDNHLTLVNKDGKTITESVKLFEYMCKYDILDAKKYDNDLLVTCYQNTKIIKLSADGKSITEFSDLSPCFPLGIYVTPERDVLVGLKSKFNLLDQHAKVARLDRNGGVIQTTQYDDVGAILYRWPYSVVLLKTGEMIVSDRGMRKKVLCLNNKGQRLFDWRGETQRSKTTDKFDPYCITHDEYNNLFITDRGNHRVWALNKDGTDAKCLLDSTQGIELPYGIAVDCEGKLWIGCKNGTIHVIEY